jgi:hypothetical protein
MDLATDDVRALQERVARVEKQARWSTAMATVLALLCAALVVWQFVPHDQVLEARGFVVRDAQWRVRAELAARRDGSPVLRLNNPYGRPRAVLHLRDDGVVALRLMDQGATNRAVLTLDKRGQPSLVLSGPDSSARVILRSEESGEEGVQGVAVRDRRGRPVWSSPASARGDQAARSK